MVLSRTEDHTRLTERLKCLRWFQNALPVDSLEPPKFLLTNISVGGKIYVFGQLQGGYQQNGALQFVVSCQKRGRGRNFFCCHVLEYQHFGFGFMSVRMLLPQWVVNSESSFVMFWNSNILVLVHVCQNVPSPMDCKFRIFYCHVLEFKHFGLGSCLPECSFPSGL